MPKAKDDDKKSDKLQASPKSGLSPTAAQYGARAAALMGKLSDLRDLMEKAKDRFGHGSNARRGGGSGLSVADQHQHGILRDTVRNPLKGKFLGGPSAEEAEATLRSKFGYKDRDIAALGGR